MKELFLRLLAPCEELDVVDEKQVAGCAVARAELVHSVVLDRGDEFVREALSGDVDDSGRRSLSVHAIRDRLHQVRFAEPGSTANEQRIVTASRSTGRGDSGRVRELVGGADDEARERLPRVQVPGRGRSLRRRRQRLGGRSGRAARHDQASRADRRLERSGRDGSIEVFIDRPRDLDAPPGQIAQLSGERGQEVRLHPLEHELVLRAKRQHAVGQVVELHAAEPLVEGSWRQAARVLDRAFEDRLGVDCRRHRSIRPLSFRCFRQRVQFVAAPHSRRPPQPAAFSGTMVPSAANGLLYSSSFPEPREPPGLA